MFNKIKFPILSKNILVLQIHQESFQLVEFNLIKDSMSIKNIASMNMDIFSDLVASADSLKQAIKSSGMKAKNLIINMPLQYCKLLPVSIPDLIPKEEIPAIVSQELNIEGGSSMCSYFTLNSTHRKMPDGSSQTDVLGVGVQGNIIDFLKLLSKTSDLKLKVISPSFFSFLPFMQLETPGDIVASCWITRTNTEFVAWSSAEPIYEHLFLTMDLFNQLFQSVNAIQGQLQGLSIKKIVTGGPALSEVDLSTMSYNFQPVSLPPYITIEENIRDQFKVDDILPAIGSAISFKESLNIPNLLLKPKLPLSAPKNIVNELLKQISGLKIPFLKTKKPLDPLIARAIVLSVLLFVLSVFSNVFIRQFMISSVNSEKAAVDNKMFLAQSRFAKVSNYDKENQVLNLKADYFWGLISKRTSYSEIVREVADMTPKTLWIDRMEIRNKKIDIFGRAIDVDSVATFSINLNYTADLVGKSKIISLRKFQEDELDFIEYQVSVNILDDKKPSKESKNKISWLF